MKLTQEDIATLPVGEHRDDEVPGLVVRVRATKKGALRTFVLRYRRRGGGKHPRPKIGDARTMTLAKARKEAKTLIGGRWVGKDPAEVLKLTRQGAQTVKMVGQAYLDGEPLADSTRREWQRFLEVELTAIADRDPGTVTRTELRDLFDSKLKREGKVIKSGYIANRLYSFTHRFWEWGISKDKMDASAGLAFIGLSQPWAGEKKRRRVLSPEELRALVLAIDDLRTEAKGHDHYADALLLLLLTGVRRRAVLLARTDELSRIDDPKRALWTVPPEHLKVRERRRESAEPHLVPLSAQAIVVLKRRLEETAGGDFLFPRARAARSAARDTTWWSSRWVKKLQTQMAKRLGSVPKPWVVHSLRHTLATSLGEGLKFSAKRTVKVRGAVIPGILGHAAAEGTTARYELAERLDERREALQAYADWLDALRRDLRVVQAS